MKIGMLSWESLHSIRVGGLAQAVTGMAEGLAKVDQEVHIFTRVAENQSEYEEIDGVHYHRCDFDYDGGILNLSRKMCEALTERVREVEDESEEFNIIHGHDWLVADALHELESHNIVMSFHSTEHGRVGEISKGISSKIAGKEWLGAHIADEVTTVSDPMREELVRHYGVPAEKIHVVPNGCFFEDLEKKVDPGVIKEGYDIHPLTPLILYLGRLEYQKGPDIMVEAIPHVLEHRGDAFFIIAGKGEMKPQLEKRIEELGVSDRVRMPGYVSEEGKLDYLNASDIVCIPSRNEPFGLVLFEAWSAGDAVVASNVGGLGENIDNFVNGIKTDPEPKPIAWGINFAIDDPELVKRFGREGKEKLKEFRWDRIGKELLVIYEAAQNE